MPSSLTPQEFAYLQYILNEVEQSNSGQQEDNGRSIAQSILSKVREGSVPGSVPIIQDSIQFVNTNEPHSASITAVATELYAVSLYLDSLGDGVPSDLLTATLSWTQPSTNIIHTVELSLAGDTDNVQMETYPILTKAGTAITLSTVFSNNPFHYDVAVRLVQMP